MVHLQTKKIIDALATGTSEVIGEDVLGGANSVNFWAVFSAGVSAGVITIEGAMDALYAGTWASLGTIPWVAASSVGAPLRLIGSFPFIRARISTNIVGGTVDVWSQISK